jgi:chromosomal replication initiation ATPase DnaA
MLPSMHTSTDNQPLGIVEEARRRREQYARYIERRVVVTLESPATMRRIEQLVSQRVEAEVARLVAERAERRLAEVERVVVPKGPPLGEILAAVAGAAQVTVGELLGPRRARELAWPRQLAILLTSELRPDLSTPDIGRAFVGRDHTTILHARKAACGRIADPASHSARLYRAARAELAPSREA